jgi:hypothetical protein
MQAAKRTRAQASLRADMDSMEAEDSNERMVRTSPSAGYCHAHVCSRCLPGRTLACACVHASMPPAECPLPADRVSDVNCRQAPCSSQRRVGLSSSSTQMTRLLPGLMTKLLTPIMSKQQSTVAAVAAAAAVVAEGVPALRRTRPARPAAAAAAPTCVAAAEDAAALWPRQPRPMQLTTLLTLEDVPAVGAHGALVAAAVVVDPVDVAVGAKQRLETHGHGAIQPS